MAYRDHVYKVDELVIGGTLEAAVYAYVRGSVLVYTQSSHQRSFEFLDPDVDLRHLSMTNEKEILPTPEGDVVVGMMKKILWNRIIWNNSLLGNTLGADQTVSIRVEIKGLVHLVLENGKKIAIDAKQIKIFHPCIAEGVESLIHIKDSSELIVYDWIEYRTQRKMKYWLMEPKDEVIQKVFVYDNGWSQDFLVVSKMTREQVDNPDYNEVMIKFKLFDLLNKHKIKFLEWNIKPIEREIFTNDKVRYKNYANIEFLDLPIDFTMNLQARKEITGLRNPRKVIESFQSLEEVRDR